MVNLKTSIIITVSVLVSILQMFIFNKYAFHDLKSNLMPIFSVKAITSVKCSLCKELGNSQK